MRNLLVLTATLAFLAYGSAAMADRGGHPNHNSNDAASDANAHGGNSNANGGRSGGDPQSGKGNDGPDICAS